MFIAISSFKIKPVKDEVFTQHEKHLLKVFI